MSMYKAQRLLAETMRNRRKQQREQQEQQQQPDDFVASNTRSFADKSYQNFRQQRRISQPVNQKDSQQQINGKRRQQPVREPLRQCSNNSQQQSLRRSVCQKATGNKNDNTCKSDVKVAEADSTSTVEVAPAEPSRLPCLDRSATLPADVPDADQRGHCTMVTAYAKDIFVYLAERELAYTLPNNLLSGHAEITERSRAV
ncbi:hypothetical protein BOX15_Mlig031863g2 [Macrostomum lignano]|uniref:Uncharacterized protein n=1 Tax=Macrostomum lignano TaxID=282301 RepID=A0A267EGU5_9PLAT|nr:hypothetical protein BOX15_Mlig031863g2 [Macrostomum lignano]